MKKITVNDGACIGCGACVAIDPEHFQFNDEGLSHAISDENIDTSEVKSAIDACPTSAISIGSDESCNCLNDGNCECVECHCENNCSCHEE